MGDAKSNNVLYSTRLTPPRTTRIGFGTEKVK